MYELKFTAAAVADVKALPRKLKAPLKRALRQKLARDPAGCACELTEPLSGFRSFHWRDYRVVFRIFEEQKMLAVVGIGERAPQSRSNLYRRLEALAEQGKLAADVLAVLRKLGGR